MVDPRLFQGLEEMGLQAVKESLAMGKAGQVGSEHHNAVSSWVKLQEEAAASEASARRDAREEETLAIAKEANEIARSASFAATAAASAATDANDIARSNRRIAIAAAVIAIASAIAQIIWR